MWIIDFEDGKILSDGDDETMSKISKEMEAINEILRDIKKSRGCTDDLPLSESGDLNAWLSSLTVH